MGEFACLLLYRAHPRVAFRRFPKQAALPVARMDIRLSAAIVRICVGLGHGWGATGGATVCGSRQSSRPLGFPHGMYHPVVSPLVPSLSTYLSTGCSLTLPHTSCIPVFVYCKSGVARCNLLAQPIADRVNLTGESARCTTLHVHNTSVRLPGGGTGAIQAFQNRPPLPTLLFFGNNCRCCQSGHAGPGANGTKTSPGPLGRLLDRNIFFIIIQFESWTANGNFAPWNRPHYATRRALCMYSSATGVWH